MNEITLRSDFDVELVESAGSDELICKAARVSTLGAESINSKESEGLIRYLMFNRHGSPFEHGLLMFRISAPIFVWREFMRHRIGFSYNEQSGRYMEMLPTFYIPPSHRPLAQVGKNSQYILMPGADGDYNFLVEEETQNFKFAWDSYQRKLSRGIAKEVARNNLPVAIYSSAYVTCNPRSMMSFLSLRTKRASSKFPSTPQWEIDQVATQMERLFTAQFPITFKAFNDGGRVSP